MGCQYAVNLPQQLVGVITHIEGVHNDHYINGLGRKGKLITGKDLFSLSLHGLPVRDDLNHVLNPGQFLDRDTCVGPYDDQIVAKPLVQYDLHIAHQLGSEALPQRRRAVPALQLRPGLQRWLDCKQFLHRGTIAPRGWQRQAPHTFDPVREATMSSKLTVEPIQAFTDNYIWLLHDAAAAAVVDPGDPEPVLATLAERQLQLRDILVTHHHFDHTGGLEALKEATGCCIWGPRNTKITAVDRRVSEGEIVTILDTDFSILEVPGHTLDHIAYVADGIVFCGDTLFAGGCGRVFEGTFAMMRHSLSKLRQLPPDTHIYCAHEYTLANLSFAMAADPDNESLKSRVKRCEALRQQGEPTVPSLLADELATNPFLRWDAPGLIRNLAGLDRLDGQGGDAVFSGLRQWKDTF